MIYFAKFMVFSMIEVMALMWFTLAIFRFRIRDYLWQAFLMGIVMNIMSYLLRDELQLDFLVPVSFVLLLSLFASIFLNAPIAWSCIIGVGGYVSFGLIQVLISKVSFGYLSIAEINANPDRGYILQTVTGIAIYILSFYLYRFGIGFATNFNKLRMKFRWERFIILGMIVIITLSLGALIYFKEIYFDIMFLIISFLFFFYYTAKKEVESNDSKIVPGFGGKDKESNSGSPNKL